MAAGRRRGRALQTVLGAVLQPASPNNMGTLPQNHGSIPRMGCCVESRWGGDVRMHRTRVVRAT